MFVNFFILRNKTPLRTQLAKSKVKWKTQPHASCSGEAQLCECTHSPFLPQPLSENSVKAFFYYLTFSQIAVDHHQSLYPHSPTDSTVHGL